MDWNLSSTNVRQVPSCVVDKVCTDRDPNSFCVTKNIRNQKMQDLHEERRARTQIRKWRKIQK